MPVNLSGSLSIGDLRTYYGKSGQTALTSFYKNSSSAAKAPPVSPLNASVPSSGVISISNLYGSYRLATGAGGNILPANSSTNAWQGYQEQSALISDLAFGTPAPNFVSTYTDGNSASRRLNGFLYNIAQSRIYFKTATSSTTNNDAGLYRIYIAGGSYPFGVEFYTSAAATTGMQGTPGSAQYGRFWTWDASNPFTIGQETFVAIDFLQ